MANNVELDLSLHEEERFLMNLSPKERGLRES